MTRRTPRSQLSDPLFPYTPFLRSHRAHRGVPPALCRVPLSTTGGPEARRVTTNDGTGLTRSAPTEGRPPHGDRSEEHTSELQSLMRSSYAVSFLKKKIETYQCDTITADHYSLITSSTTTTYT